MPVAFFAAWLSVAPAQEPKAGKPTAEPLRGSGGYLRVVRPDTNTVQLQVAAWKFTPADRTSPVVWLVGAAHLGETNYYQTLQKLLDAQALVLFEGVGHHPKKTDADKSAPVAANPEAKIPAARTNKFSSLQSTLAESLGLVFQLDGIDYDRAHFQNSDLSAAQIQKLMAGDGADAADDQEFNQLVQMMDGSSFVGSLMNGVARLIGSSPQLRATTRLMLVETLGNLRGDVAQMRGLTPGLKQLMAVLIEERNKAVVRDLKTELEKARPPASIAVFYGAGHMADLEKRIQAELHLQPVGALWLPAISVRLNQTGLTPEQLEMLRTMIQTQMKHMLPEK